MQSREANSTSNTVVQKSEESPGNQRADRASDAFVIGVDADGRDHYYPRIRGTVTVLEGDEHVTQSLDGEDLNEWKAFVEDRCGWQEWNYCDGGLGEAIEDLVQAIGGSA